jgi:hypothetical protein
MAPLGALSQAWVSAEASLPLGWQISGLWRWDGTWVALSEGPAFDDYLSGSGQTPIRRFGGWLIGCGSGGEWQAARER